jgi:hypothetical protein
MGTDSQLYLYQGDKASIKGCGKQLTRRGTLRGIISAGSIAACGEANEVAIPICHACAEKNGIANEIF